jgi:hypothetical protein
MGRLGEPPLPMNTGRFAHEATFSAWGRRS